MKASIIGCGKLGFPVALAWATKHDMVGYDVSPAAKEILASRKYPHREEGAQALLETTTLRIVDTVAEAVAHGEIVFIAVQTPHQPEFEGITRMPEHRADFDYGALVSAVRAVAHEALVQKKPVTIAVISTCLPGTCQREIYPFLNEYTGFVYQPMFIAMGTTIADALNPEFLLLGCDRDKDKVSSLERVQNFFREVHAADHAIMPVASAELTKVSYNVFLGLKIVAANSVMEIAHKLRERGVDVNCDDVSNALAKATDRVVSSKYMRGGMGDGGGCHPRDQIALSWLAQELGLSYDLFGAMVEAREKQTEWLGEIAIDAGEADHDVTLLGKAYKKGTNLTVGSPAILLKNIIDEWAYIDGHDEVSQWDPHVDEPRSVAEPGVFVIASEHDEFYATAFPKGSTIIDPWGKMKDQDGCKVVRVGRP